MGNGVPVVNCQWTPNFSDDLMPICHKHWKEKVRARRILRIVNIVYFTLFIPLMMLPIIGWLPLIWLGNYKEKLEWKSV